jgi:uracil-DNA glycosylase
MDLRIRPEEFAKVIGCTACSSTATDPHLLRDQNENVPQPGYIGPRYEQTRLLLVGQNPAQPPSGLVVRDRTYTGALRALLGTQTWEAYGNLVSLMPDYMRDWPIYDEFFSLEECGLDVTEIAYCNVVRCRTEKNGNGYWAPNSKVVEACRPHLLRWIRLLRPTAVILIGKWSADNLSQYLPPDMPRIVMRRRSKERNTYMTTEEKACQRRSAADFVQKYIRSA